MRRDDLVALSARQRVDGVVRLVATVLGRREKASEQPNGPVDGPGRQATSDAELPRPHAHPVIGDVYQRRGFPVRQDVALKVLR